MTCFSMRYILLLWGISPPLLIDNCWGWPALTCPGVSWNGLTSHRLTWRLENTICFHYFSFRLFCFCFSLYCFCQQKRKSKENIRLNYIYRYVTVTLGYFYFNGRWISIIHTKKNFMVQLQIFTTKIVKKY